MGYDVDAFCLQVFGSALKFRWLTDLALFTFYVQTWDEYHTHTLTLGLVSGPVEGILTLAIVYAITALKGRGSFWQQSMIKTIGYEDLDFLPSSIIQLSWTDVFMVYGGIVLIFNTVQR